MTRFISFLGFKANVRPHPGLLPQEKVNRSPSSFQFTASGVRTTNSQILGESSADMSSPGGEETGEGERKTPISFLQQFPHAQRLGRTPGLRVAAALCVRGVAVEDFRNLPETAFVQ